MLICSHQCPPRTSPPDPTTQRCNQFEGLPVQRAEFTEHGCADTLLTQVVITGVSAAITPTEEHNNNRVFRCRWCGALFLFCDAVIVKDLQEKCLLVQSVWETAPCGVEKKKPLPANIYLSPKKQVKDRGAILGPEKPSCVERSVL